MPRNRRFATVEKSYITDIERERCKKVAAAYAELYELESILVWHGKHLPTGCYKTVCRAVNGCGQPD